MRLHPNNGLLLDPFGSQRSAGPKRCLRLERWIPPNHSFPEQEGALAGFFLEWQRTTAEDGGYGRLSMQNWTARPRSAGSHRNHNPQDLLSHGTQRKEDFHSRIAGHLGWAAESRPDPIHLHRMESPKVLSSGRARQRAERGRAGACGGDSY